MKQSKIKLNKKWFGALCVILGCSIWGSTGIAVRELGYLNFSTFDIIATRCVVGSVAVGLYVLFTNPSCFKIKLKDSWIFFGTGILNMLFNGICYFYCIQNIDLAIACALNLTGPMFALMFGCLIFKEPFTFRKALAMILTFGGCLLLCGFSGSEKVTLIGVILGIGAGIGYSMYSVFGRFGFNKGYDAVTITFYSMILCTIGIAPFLNWGNMVQTVISVPKSWLWIIMLGLGDGFIGYILYTVGLKHIEIGVASILSYFELVASTLCGIILYKEPMTMTIAIGLLCIFAGIVVCNFVKTKDVEPEDG